MINIPIDFERYLTELKTQFKKDTYEYASLPTGHIRILKGYTYNVEYVKSFDKEDQPIYLTKKKSINKNEKLIKELVRSSFLKRTLDIEEKLIEHIEKVNKYNSLLEAQKIIDSMPTSYRKFSIEYFLPDTRDTSQWELEEYPINENYPESLAYLTDKKHYVRSKSECTLANKLYHLEIPYRYEAPVEIQGITYRPDFTIMRKRDGKIIYWEHFGNTHEPAYVKSLQSKMNKFIESGLLLPWDNLIVTYEYHIKYPGIVDEIINSLLL
ncbi:MAG: hypothetical protein RR967_02015 [Anaerovoracaceae bacterium]